MTDGIIFDVDGTFWDTTFIVEKAWNAALDEMGLSHIRVTAEQLKGLFGLPMDVIIENIMPEQEKAVQEAYLPLCSKYEFDYLEKEMGRLYPDFEETLDGLSKKYPLFIVSNCQSGYIEMFLEKTGFGKYFKDYVCPGDSGLLKAGNISLIAERNGLKAPVYVGDTQMDANACKEAGVPIVHARYGFGTVEEPDYVIDRPIELLELDL